MKEKLKSIFKKNSNKVKTMLASISLLIVSKPVFAADNTYARQASNWVMDGIQTVVLVVAAAMVIKFLISRQFLKMVGTLIGMAVVVAIVFKPEVLLSLGNNLLSIIGL